MSNIKILSYKALKEMINSCKYLHGFRGLIVMGDGRRIVELMSNQREYILNLAEHDIKRIGREFIEFKNGSRIDFVTVWRDMRGMRANEIICDYIVCMEDVRSQVAEIPYSIQDIFIDKSGKCEEDNNHNELDEKSSDELNHFLGEFKIRGAG